MALTVEKIDPQKVPLSDSALSFPKSENRRRKVLVTTVEAVIVGSGITGAYTGYSLARRDIDSVVLNSNPYPANPNLITLSQNDIAAFHLNDFCLCRKYPAPLDIIAPGGKRFTPPESQNLCFFKKEYLVQKILEKARETGCPTFKEKIIRIEQENGGWIIHTSNRVLRCRVLIGADRSVNRVKKAISHCPRKETEVFGIGYSFYYNGPRQNGITLFSNGETMKMVCDGNMLYAELLGPLQTGYGRRKRLEKLLKEQIGSLQFCSTWTTALPDIYNPYFFEKPCSGKNWILTPSAAGHVHPVSGDGALFAFASGELTAQALECGDPRVFDSLWSDSYGKTLAKVARVRKYFHSPFVANALFGAASRSSSVAKSLSALLLPSTTETNGRSNHSRTIVKILFEMAGFGVK